MTKKDYELIAAAIKEAEPSTDLALRIMVFRISDHLKADNPRFSHEQFYKACGLAHNQYKHLEAVQD